MCSSSFCQQIKKCDNHIIEYLVACSSRCELCVQIKDICATCIKLGHSNYLPCLRVCMSCSELNRKCMCVCVCTSIQREGFICLDSCNASEQTNDFMLKTWISSTKSLHRYFRMKLQAFLTSCFILFTH